MERWRGKRSAIAPLRYQAQLMAPLGARGSKPSAGEAERSGKRGHCAAFNEALPVQQRLPRGGE